MTILTALAQIGAIFAQKASAKALSNGLNNISKSFSVGSPMQAGNTSFIEIKVDEPSAVAFEYGSGIHRTKGSPGKYWILPKNKGALAFEWPGHTADFPRRGKYIGPSRDGNRLVFLYVEHPGVEARPFLRPTIDDTREEFKKILGQGFKAEILQGVNKIEVIEVK